MIIEPRAEPADPTATDRASGPSGPPRRPDRALPHLVWEAVLLAGAVAALAALATGPGARLFDDGSIWARVALVGVLASGLALSVRVGTPNLAVGAFASIAAVLYAGFSSLGATPVAGVLIALGVCVVLGGLLAVATVLLRAPGWAVSLVGLAVLQPALFVLTAGDVVGVYGPTLERVWYPVLFGLFVVGSVGGALLWRRFGTAPGSDVRWRRALLGMVGSSALAAVAGVLTAAYLGAAVPSTNGAVLWPALAAVLLGGLGLNGRGGGVAGTALGATIVVAVDEAARRSTGSGTGDLWPDLLPGLFALLGLVAAAVLDRLARGPGTATGAGR